MTTVSLMHRLAKIEPRHAQYAGAVLVPELASQTTAEAIAIFESLNGPIPSNVLPIILKEATHAHL